MERKTLAAYIGNQYTLVIWYFEEFILFETFSLHVGDLSVQNIFFYIIYLQLIKSNFYGIMTEQFCNITV